MGRPRPIGRRRVVLGHQPPILGQQVDEDSVAGGDVAGERFPIKGQRHFRRRANLGRRVVADEADAVAELRIEGDGHRRRLELHRRALYRDLTQWDAPPIDEDGQRRRAADPGRDAHVAELRHHLARRPLVSRIAPLDRRAAALDHDRAVLLQRQRRPQVGQLASRCPPRQPDAHRLAGAVGAGAEARSQQLQTRGGADRRVPAWRRGQPVGRLRQPHRRRQGHFA